ncbi:MAG: hypothetical protein E7126_07180 [Rikenellaceae bacterium]|nr:hypothetical protein [Rikenellaceae bacterium]
MTERNNIISNIFRSLLVVVALVVAQPYAEAQRPTLSGSFSRDTVEVGDHFDYILDITKDRATEIGIPDFGDRLSQKEREELAKRKIKMSTFTDYDEDIFELVESFPIDTISVDNRTLHIRKRYRLAVMETGTMHLHPTILYFEKNRDVPDTLRTDEELTLIVPRYEHLDTLSFLVADPQQGVKVDSLRAAELLIKEGITTQKPLPFIFAEIRDYTIYGVISLIILALLIWAGIVVWNKYLKNRITATKPEHRLPPHIVANMALVELSYRKLWQNGKFKLYYTSLTDILRLYIAEMWEVGALEMTTDEIIEALSDKDIPRDSRMDLVAILRTADMVKFAKAEPDAEENEENYRRAYYFVENTKREEVEEGKEEITVETKIGE